MTPNIMSVVPATDDEIRAFQSDVAALRKRVEGAFGAAYLSSLWDCLDFLPTAESGDALPLSAIKRGDVVYRGAGREYSPEFQCNNYFFSDCHAIFAATTKRLAQELAALNEETLRRRSHPAKMVRRKVYKSDYWKSCPDDAFAKLMDDFKALRDCATQAAAADRGLLFFCTRTPGESSPSGERVGIGRGARRSDGHQREGRSGDGR